jgi:M6 family metalloprotease-like protein
MRGLKIVLGTAIFAGLTVLVAGWITGSHISVAAGEVYIGPETEKFVRYVQAAFGCSRRDAIAFMHEWDHRNGTRIADRFEIPPGAQVDFIEVDGTKGGKAAVRFLGTGRAVPAFSEEGLNFWRIFERVAKRKGWHNALAAMSDLRRRGVVITPAWFGAPWQAVPAAATKRPVKAMGTARTYRVAVICARFPAWVDRSPWSNGNGIREPGVDIFYNFDPGSPPRRHVDPRVNPADQTTWPGTIDWYLDSPGGRMPANGGEPLGTQVQWNDTHPARTPDPLDGPTTPQLQEYWYRRLFDLNFTGGPKVGGGSWPGSLRNYYWDNSHGCVSLTGQRTDIFGWVESHHILDRLAFPNGPSPVYMIQPGTPLIRPSDQIDGYPDAILRASLTQNKLTILYRDEHYSTPSFQLWAYQRDIDGGTSGNQPGWAQILTANTGDTVRTTAIMDPYDARRWTFVNVKWEYWIGPNPDNYSSFQIWAGQPWRVTSDGFTWQQGNPNYRPQDQGCGELPNTTFTTADVALQPGTTAVGTQNPPWTTGNRMKSFDYYCHDHFVNTSRGPYQIAHLRHNGYIDDIGGDTEEERDRRPRPYPFDCGMPSDLGGSDRMQLGYFHYPSNNNRGDHSAAGMRTDVNATLTDMDVSVSGYDRVVYVFAGPGVAEGGSPGSWGTIIAHAGGGMVTVGEDAGLTIMAHEMGHTFGMGDLYDQDFYINHLNGTPPNPLYFECSAMGPYSVMAMGGVRVDAYHKIKLGWLSGGQVVELTEDRPNAEIPAVEGILREPVVYKLPASPYYIVDGVAPSAWQEYYLVEYRDVPDAKPAGYYGDPSPQGVYIYHIDERGVGQMVEGLMGVLIEQADGLDELEVNPNGNVGNLEGDPFPGSTNNRNFCQWDFNVDEWLAGNPSPRRVPPAWSHGLFNTNPLNGRPQKIAGTETDSFTRVLNIRLSGPMAYADIYVRPRELIVSGKGPDDQDADAWQDIVDMDGKPDYVTWQGRQNTAVMKLTLRNPSYKAGDYSALSTGDVVLRRLEILESGSSPNNADVRLVKLWNDENGDGQFDPRQDTLISSATVGNVRDQVATFDGLNYEIPLDQSRTLFVTYDISTTAQVNPKVTVGGDLPEPRYVWPEPPAAVQERRRNAAQFSFGNPRFPVQTAHVAEVLDGTDTLLIASTSLAPAAVKPNDKNVPVLRLVLNVNQDRVILKRLRFRYNPDVGAGHTATDPRGNVEKATLWEDLDQNGVIDPTKDRKVAEAVFSNATDLIFDNLSYTVAAGSTVHLLLAFDILEDAKPGEWLEIELPASGVTLVDEDGPNNSLYGDPSQPGLAWTTATPPHDVLVAGQDKVDTTGAPWKSVDFVVQPPTAPVLSNATLSPGTGSKSDVYTFRVTYTSAAGILPKEVKLCLRNVNWPAATANLEYKMLEVNPADTNVKDGKDYQVQVTGRPPLDWWTHKHYFMANDGYTTVYYYTRLGTASPATYADRPPRQKAEDAELQEWLPGPFLYSRSMIRFADSAWVTAGEYEEGLETDPARAPRVYVEVVDEDRDTSAAPDTLQVVLTVGSPATDTETVTLTETGDHTYTFRGSLPTIGRSGANEDGWLNAAAGGPRGVRVTAAYTDANNNYNGTDYDVSSAAATVYDRTPPPPVTALTLTSSPQGDALDVAWDSYSAPLDLATYEVYYSTNNFTTVPRAGVTLAGTVTDGSKQFTITGLSPGTRYYVAVVPFDEVPNPTKPVAVTTVAGDTVDTAPPVILARNPDDGARDIPVDQRAITVQVQDTGVGIDAADANAVQVQVRADDGGGARTVPGTLKVTGGATPQDPVTITWTANADWHWNDVVTVRLRVKDRATPTGNVLDATWTFRVIEDHVAPVIVSRAPAAGATEVALDQRTITVVVRDTIAGIDTGAANAIALAVTANDGSGARSVSGTLNVQPGATPQDPVRLTWTADANWRWNDVVTVHLTVRDRVIPTPNVLDATWSFRARADRAAPIIVSQDPAENATQVAVDYHTITVVVQDTVSGIDTSAPGAISLTVSADDGTGARTPAGTLTIAAGATPQDPVTLTWTADADWRWNDVVSVTLRVRDVAGNVLSKRWSFRVVEDHEPPFVDQRSPDAGAQHVSLSSTISFQLRDLVSGVDVSTRQVELRIVNRGQVRQDWTSLVGQPGFSETWSSDFTVGALRYRPPQNWRYNDEIWVRARAKDRAGNAMADWEVWSFKVLEDTDDLQIVDEAPTGQNVSRNTNISFRVIDAVSGVARSSIALEVDGTPVPANALVITGSASDYTVVYDPPSDFGYGQTVTCRATAMDMAGNRTEKQWSFTTVGDGRPPSITPLDPLANASGVPVDTNIKVRISDGETGVDVSRVSIEVNGGAIGGQLTVTPEAGGTAATAVFDPATALPYGSQVQVRVEAWDKGLPAPNQAVLTYNFTTQPAPRYTIVGRVTDQATGAGLTAVEVQLSGAATATTQTDSNGYYQFRDLLGGDYTITPRKLGFVFTPANRTYTALAADVNDADFQGREVTYALSGRVVKAGVGLAGVTIQVDGQQVTTGTDGTWRLSGLRPGSYTIQPTYPNHRFEPPSRVVEITNADVAGLDFEAIPLSYSVAGQVTDQQGNRLEAVRVTLDGRTAITDASGRYQVGGVAAGTVEVRAEKEGWVFWWQDETGQWHSGPRPVSVPPDRTDVNFVGYRFAAQSFAAGLHLLGVPIVPRDPSPTAVFGTDAVFRYDPTLATPDYLCARTQPDAELLRVEPGRGFFVYFRHSVDLQVPGTPLPPDQPVSVALARGWNMVANPFLGTLRFQDLQVVSGSVRPYAYVYDPVQGSYLLISARPGVGVARSYILPWEGMWLNAVSDAAVQMKAAAGPGEAAEAKALELDLGSGGWWLPVTARVGDKTDRCCAVGVKASGAGLALLKPPMMPGTVDVAVVGPNGERLARAIEAAGKALYEWDLVVTAAVSNAEVEVALPDLSRLPRELVVTLTDLETSKSVYARTMRAYRFRVGEGGGVRHFRLTVAPRSSAGLVLSAACAQPQAGGRVVVTYSASVPCSVSARVLNLAGRPVRILASGLPAAAGVNTLTWDGRNASGAPAPAGLYLIEIEATADNGQRVKAITQMRLSR